MVGCSQQKKKSDCVFVAWLQLERIQNLIPPAASLLFEVNLFHFLNEIVPSHTSCYHFITVNLIFVPFLFQRKKMRMKIRMLQQMHSVMVHRLEIRFHLRLIWSLHIPHWLSKGIYFPTKKGEKIFRLNKWIKWAWWINLLRNWVIMVDLHTQELHRFTSYDNASVGQCSLRCSYSKIPVWSSA